MIQPKSKEELQKLIEEAIETNGASCDLNHIDTSLITDMSGLFEMAECFNGDISRWDVSNVVEMFGMFCDSDFNGDISGWDTSNVKDMSCMFEKSKFTGDISKWDTSNVIKMDSMFLDARFNGDISQWDISNVKRLAGMFWDSQFTGDLRHWNLTDDQMEEAFMDSLPEYLEARQPILEHEKLKDIFQSDNPPRKRESCKNA